MDPERTRMCCNMQKEENNRKGDSSIETTKYAHMISGSMHEI